MPRWPTAPSREGRIAALDTAAAEAAPGVVLVHDPPERAAAEAAAAVHGDVAEAAGGERPAGHAGRPDPLERPAGRGGAGRDAGTGRPRGVADPRRPTRPSRPRPSFDAAKAHAKPPKNVLGEPAAVRDRRCRGCARRRAVTRRQHLPDAAPQPQRHRAPCGRPSLGRASQLTVHDASQMVAPDRARPRPTCSAFRTSRCACSRPSSAAASAARPVESPDPGGRRGQAGRPAGAARPVARGRVPGRRRPHADRAAGGARRRRATAGSTALIHTGVAAMTTPQRLPRAVHLPGPPPLCRRRHSSSTQKVADARHGRQHLHARAGRVGRHLRARMRDRRAGRRARHRPDRAAAAQRAGEGPDLAARLLLAPSRRGLPARGRTVRLGRAQSPRRAHGARAMAGRHGRRDRRPIPTTACRAARRGSRSPPTAAPIVADGARTRWAWAPRPCRPSSPPSGWGLPIEQVTLRLRRHALPGRHDGRRLARRPPRSARRSIAAQRGAGRRADQARRQRFPAGRARRRTRSEARTAGCASATSRSGRELRLDPGPRRARRDRRGGQPRRRRSRCSNSRCTPTARSSARCASTRSPARRG